MGVIRQCSCNADRHGNPAGAQYQDRQYGKGNRLFTDDPKRSQFVSHCTVCGRELKIQKGSDTEKK